MSGPAEAAVSRSVGIVGGGLAGLAAAAAAVEQGFRVELFEQGKQLGGRAGAFHDPRTGTLVDYCRHVTMGCCTNLADFCRRTGVADCFRRLPVLHFFGPDGRRCDFGSAGWLPAPLHLGPGLMRLRYLTPADRWRIGRTLRRLAKEDPHDDRQSVGAWLRCHGQSDEAIERFWSVVLVSALSETIDNISLAAARQIFVEGFLANRRAYEVHVPTVPLAEIFDRRVGAWLNAQGVAVHRNARVARLEGDAQRAGPIVLQDGARREFDFVVLAVPWRRVRSLCAPGVEAAVPALHGVEAIRPSPITAVHLRFDRPVVELSHAVLVGRLSQWLFRDGEAPGNYQVVISASHELIGRRREEILAEVRRELASLWPEFARAELVHGQVVTHPAAVFSVGPGLERLRPAQQTPIPNLLLAGDWTDTGWPATMEGAVRSGRLAVEKLLESLKSVKQLVTPGLKPSWMFRWCWGENDEGGPDGFAERA